jgi:tetratricopeptide (TPR) repeat protein
VRELTTATQDQTDVQWVSSSFELGLNYYRQGLHSEASNLFAAILEKKPDHSLALYYQGFIAYLNKQYEVAEKMIGRALQLDPGNARYLCHFGLLAIDQGKFQLAVESLNKAIEIKPDYADALLNLSAAYFHLGEYNRSIEYSRKNLQVQPDNAKAYHNIGKCLCNLFDFAGSIQNFERALEIDPLYVAAYTSLAATYFELKNLTAVSKYCMKAIELDPNHANGYLHLGMACQEQGNLTAAETFMLHAAALAPEDYVIHWNIGLLMLAMGKLELGWKGYEVRWHLQKVLGIQLWQYPYPWWQGEAMPDKTLLIWWEQGIGDQIMFASLYEDVLARFKKCIVSCPQKMLSLLARSFPAAQFVPREDPDQLLALRADIEVQSPLGSLARWLRPTVTSFPKKQFYLVPDDARVNFWRTRLAELGPGLKVGVCWRSSNVAGGREFYCTKIAQWKSILTVPGVHFVNLQYDECVAELDEAHNLFGTVIHAYPEVDLLNDLDESAALSKALDLVIAIPTSAVILSAAVGVPSWMLSSGFTWQKFGTAENCWYGTARYFTHQWDKRWEDLLPEVALELKKLSVRDV